MNKNSTKLFILLLSTIILFTLSVPGKINPELFKNIKARSIGPANMSGRIGDIDAVNSNPRIIYIGTATGGVWKSVDEGIIWKPVFDKESSSSIGAVKIFQKNPNIVWIGTGEGNPRNSSGVGRGVFKTMDGGKTWLYLGLGKTERISRIILDTDNPDIAYIAAMGTTWGENSERGVFKTTDGGKSWKKILFVDNKTGAADLTIDPSNPNKLIAAMWDHRRWPWFFRSGGPGSGLYITTDAGNTWKKLTEKDGLPKGELGRIGVAFAPGKPNIVYAIIEAKKSAFFRSNDGGFKWKLVNNKPGVHGRPFYYSDLRVNPKNENIVYSLQSRLKISEDGGKSFKGLASWGQAHSDFQAMWIDPDGEHMIVGTDGGVVLSSDRGKTWRYTRNLPVGQFYHVSFDMQFPYNVYGGLQDNGSWIGPSSILTDWAIYNYHWKVVGGGDGFDTEPDLSEPGCGYAMWQGGNLFHFNTKTGRSKNIRPPEGKVKLRFNWNAGFALDPFNNETIYYGSQFLHKSYDRGNSWETISPDLTTNDPERQKQNKSGGLTLDVTAAENFTTIMTIAPSPVKKGVIWVGTDDGNVQLSKDGGKSWTLLSKNIVGKKGVSKKLSPTTWIPHIEASKFDPATAFVVFDDHRRSNWEPYVFKTEDYGKHWKSIVTPEIDGFVHVIEQDHKDKDLLFIGTEFGLYVSFNGGKNWTKWTAGIPTVPVRDIRIHPRENDLIIGTYGRSIYILDDISFLRDINNGFFAKTVNLSAPENFNIYRRGRSSSYSTRGDSEFVGQNKDYRAIFTLFFNNNDNGNSKAQKEKKKLKFEILDKDNKLVKKLKVKPEKGFNRIAWDFRGKDMKVPKFVSRRGSLPGLLVMPGKYKVKVTLGENKIIRDFTVNSDPRLKINTQVLKENFKKAKTIRMWIKKVLSAAKIMESTGAKIKFVTENFGNIKPENKKKLGALALQIKKKFEYFKEKTIGKENVQGINDESETLASVIGNASNQVEDSFEPLTQSTELNFKNAKEESRKFLDEFNGFFEKDVKKFWDILKGSGFSLYQPYKPIILK